MAADQLRRVLQLIPLVADGRPHSLTDLARALGTDIPTILGDLHAVVGRHARHEGYVERVELYVSGDEVQLVSTHFMRPMRLTPAEVQAMELGLSMLRLERPPEEHAVIDRARERLRAVRTQVREGGPPGGDGTEPFVYGAPPLSERQARHLALVRQAILCDRKVAIRYRKASDESATERTISPYMVLRGAGKYFVVAYCDVADALRLFRLDRIEQMAPMHEPRRVGADVTLDGLDGLERAFIRDGDDSFEVWYSPSVARWIEEREASERQADGSAIGRYASADAEWAVRHVLQYGPEAKVLGDSEVSRLVAARLHAVAAALPQITPSDLA